MPPTSGASLELTVDAALQHVVERELARGVAEHRADSGVGDRHGPVDRRGAGDGQRPDVQPQRLRRRRRQPPAEPGRAATPTSRVDVQDIHRLGGRSRNACLTPESPIDCAPGYITDRQPPRQRRAQVRRAVVHRRHRQVEQRRRDQGGLPRRRRADAALRAPVRLRHAPVARPARRGDGHRLESAQRQRAGVGVDGLPDRRDAAADGHRRQLHRQWRPADAAARWCARSGAGTPARPSPRK